MVTKHIGTKRSKNEPGGADLFYNGEVMHKKAGERNRAKPNTGERPKPDKSRVT